MSDFLLLASVRGVEVWCSWVLSGVVSFWPVAEAQAVPNSRKHGGPHGRVEIGAAIRVAPTYVAIP